ncbi:MAG: PPOX class F420-dependent oxidoreductase [Pseudomonadales bacterium]|nr:PPOX class F420-dependent oxidoreductase [Pseudomonadales bacterium]
MPGLPFDPATTPYVSLVTYRKTGAEVKTPVWIAKNAGAYYVFSEAKAGKVKRIKNNSTVKIAKCDLKGRVSSDWISGCAQLVTDEKEIAEMYKAFDQKYGWQTRSLNFIAKLTGRIKKRAIIKVKLS